MTVIFSVAARTAKANADLTSVGSAAVLSIYGGTRPATPDTAPGSTVLVAFTMAGAFGTAATGVITANAIPAGTVTLAGTAVWARLSTSGSVAVVDFDVSTTAAGTGDIQLTTTTLAVGVSVTISSFTLTEN
jgi:hypothetical protein